MPPGGAPGGAASVDECRASGGIPGSTPAQPATSTAPCLLTGAYVSEPDYLILSASSCADVITRVATARPSKVCCITHPTDLFSHRPAPRGLPGGCLSRAQPADRLGWCEASNRGPERSSAGGGGAATRRHTPGSTLRDGAAPAAPLMLAGAELRLARLLPLHTGAPPDSTLARQCTEAGSEAAPQSAVAEKGVSVPVHLSTGCLVAMSVVWRQKRRQRKASMPAGA